MFSTPLVWSCFPLLFLFPTAGVCHPHKQTALQPEDDTIHDVWLDTGNGRTYFELDINDARYGRRNVSYFVSQAGLAIIDGDVVYGTEDQLLANRYDPESPEIVGTEAFSVFDFWPNGVIRYKYTSNSVETLLSDVVPEAISRWRTAAPYLVFTKEPNSPTLGNNILTISTTANDGCHSSKGFRDQPLAMNLQRTATGTCSCCADTATHEFGHALGLNHEHQRPDRDNFVRYQCANLRPDCDPGSSMPPGSSCCISPPGCCKKRGNFGIINDARHDATLGYDINSLMHYTRSTFARPGTDTLTPANPSVVFPPPPTRPSVLDIQRICKLYKFWCPRARMCEEAGCPTPCHIVPPCNTSPRCHDENPPDCCLPDNAGCRQQRAECTRKGCDFLKL